jgi:hypothetical protein
MQEDHAFAAEKPPRRPPWNKGKFVGVAAPPAEPRVVDQNQAANRGVQTGPRAVQPGDRQQTARS